MRLLIFALFALATPALASAQGANDPNVIHACIGNVSGLVRIIGANEECISFPAVKAETPFQWDNHKKQAAGPCFDNTNRYVNCNNGTVTDTFTGLIWLQQADCISPRDYAAANNAAALLKAGQCGLSDDSVAGDWRLPTIDEWRATLENTACTNPRLPNDAQTGCFFDGAGSSFTGVASAVYWSSSAAPGALTGTAAVSADLGVAHYNQINKVDSIRVWTVRTGPR